MVNKASPIKAWYLSCWVGFKSNYTDVGCPHVSTTYCIYMHLLSWWQLSWFIGITAGEGCLFFPFLGSLHFPELWKLDCKNEVFMLDSVWIIWVCVLSVWCLQYGPILNYWKTNIVWGVTWTTLTNPSKGGFSCLVLGIYINGRYICLHMYIYIYMYYVKQT